MLITAEELVFDPFEQGLGILPPRMGLTDALTAADHFACALVERQTEFAQACERPLADKSDMAGLSEEINQLHYYVGVLAFIGGQIDLTEFFKQ